MRDFLVSHADVVFLDLPVSKIGARTAFLVIPNGLEEEFALDNSVALRA